MQLVRYDQPDFAAALRRLTTRSAFSADVMASVAAILADVRAQGDDAVCRYARQFDRAELTPATYRVSAAELAAANAQVPAAAKEAIHLAAANVAAFAQQRVPKDWSFSPRPGVTLGEHFVPLDRVAAYIPGGASPLVSTVLHTVTLARVAGVQQIIVATPPGPGGAVNPAILYATQVAGATEVLRLGGVYAIAALAYGTATVPRVEKIVGPGNAYTTAAKRLVYGEVALDLVAGPSEVLVIADETADPAYIAADLLSQAEHGTGNEQAVLVTTAAGLAERVAGELERQRQQCRRGPALDRVLAQGVFLVVARDLEQAVAIANDYAPEHLELLTAHSENVLPKIRAAGAVFLGPWTPEPLGDFVAGPSHVLPTGGSARFFTGLTVEMFMRRMSTLQYDRAALARECGAVERFAELEGLDAHGRAARIRLGPDAGLGCPGAVP